MVDDRDIFSAVRLFQLFGGTIAHPHKLGISKGVLSALLEQEIVSFCTLKGYRLVPLPAFLRSSPYHLVKDLLPFEGSSYFNQSAVIGLGNLFQQKKIKTIVELGSWHGISTIFMATFLPANGVVYAVDHWEGSLEHTQDCSMLYHQFLSNVIQVRLTKQIIPLKMTTIEASKRCFPPIDLVYVDASHDEDSVLQDLEAWHPHVAASGGILCGDDFLWGKEKGYPVQKALKRFTDARGLSFENQGTFWKMI